MIPFSRGYLKTGLDSLRGAKWRNFWTMLGIIIGVTSVITVVSIGEGIKLQISGQTSKVGQNLIVVRPTQLKSDSSALATSNIGSLSGIAISTTLSTKDLDTVQQVKSIVQAAPLAAVPGEASGDNGNYHKGLVLGTTASFPSLLHQSLAYGTFFTDGDPGNNQAVLGINAARALFNEDVPLGRSFTFHGQQFIVDGILNSNDPAPLSQEVSFNDAIFIPYLQAENITNNTAPTYEIFAKTQDPAATANAIQQISKKLDSAHGGASGLSVLKQGQSTGASNQTLELVTRFIAGVAAISLLVGGIGIMNVMSVSVAERLHEIGIRKAIGATNRQILNQFIVESTVLSVCGGIIGIIASIAIDAALRVTTDIHPLISWQIVALATGVSLIVGIVFGSFPALKAARKDPIEALRSD